MGEQETWRCAKVISLLGKGYRHRLKYNKKLIRNIKNRSNWNVTFSSKKEIEINNFEKLNGLNSPVKSTSDSQDTEYFPAVITKSNG